jgi:amino acid transporter
MVLFLVFYIIYKYVYPGSRLVDVRELTVDKYVLPDVGSFERENPANTAQIVDPEPTPVTGDDIELESPRPVLQPNHSESHEASDYENSKSDPRDEQRRYVLEILQGRRSRPRGFLSKMWSFVVSDEN